MENTGKLEVGRIIDGRFVVQRMLGEGAAAEVYQVEEKAYGTPKALKLLKVNMATDEVRQRMLREGELLASLNHDNILQVSELITVDSRPCMVMEYIDGCSLREFFAFHDPDFDTRDALARDVLTGLAAAHAEGLVHRDMKPANVLVDMSTEPWRALLADFGLARVLDDDLRLTATGIAMGTPAYMSPEQFEDAKSVDARADVWAVGLVLYELMTGHKAFEPKTLVQAMQMAAKGDFPSPRTHVPDLPDRVVDTIMAALQTDVDKRLPDAGAMLEAWTTGSTESAAFPPPSAALGPLPPEQAAGRNWPMTLGIVGLMIGATLGCAGIGIYSAIDASGVVDGGIDEVPKVQRIKTKKRLKGKRKR